MGRIDQRANVVTYISVSSAEAKASQPDPLSEAASSALAEGTEVAARLVRSVSTVLEGKQEVVELAVTALLAQGHLLVEDVPGVGKTTLARAMANSLGLQFRRIQFTSDLLPVDVVGGSIYDQSRGEFQFREGPIFTQVLLADEINRTTPRTQSALLEAMAERQVSVEGQTRMLDAPFFVIATQNPQEFYGTYPLPESQLDRFLFRVRIGYPPPEVEQRVLRARRHGDPHAKVEAVVTKEALLSAQRAIDEVMVTDAVLGYLHAIIVATRHSAEFSLGASTRAALAFERAVRAHAMVAGRTHVEPSDIKALSGPVLAHRVMLAGHATSDANRQQVEDALSELVQRVPVPV